MTEINFSKISEFVGLLTTLDFFIYITNLIIVLIVFQALVMIFRLSKNKYLGLTVKPFSRTGNGEHRILLIGDSTAVGTGAYAPEDTIAGRLAHDFPNADIVNIAQNGGLVRDLEKQLSSLRELHFDLIIVSTGGNDVWHLTRLNNIRKHLKNVLPQLVKMSNQRVIFLIYNNIGFAPLFPSYIRGFLKWRCRKVQSVIQEEAYKAGVPTIDLFSQEEDNPFIRNPEGLFATDGVHPSSDGYRLWYHRMWRKMIEEGYRV